MLHRYLTLDYKHVEETEYFLYLTRNDEIISRDPLRAVCNSNNTELFKILYQPQISICDYVAYGGTIEMMEYCIAQGKVIDKKTFYSAAHSGRVPMLQYLISLGCPYSVKRSSYTAAFGGHFEALKYFHQLGFKFDISVSDAAAKSGRLDILVWLRSLDPPTKWGTNTCAMAAGHGHLELLKWLRQEGCPWGIDTLIWAATSGHKDIFVWAFRNGCPIDQRVINLANRTFGVEFVGIILAQGVINL